MNKNAEKLWFSAFGGSPPKEIGYVNAGEHTWTEGVKKNSRAIQEEIASFLEEHPDKLKPYFNKTLVEGKKNWRALSFKIWGWPIKENVKECPLTQKVMESIPGIVSYSVSMLEPGVDIKKHRGDTNAIIRGHLGLLIPAGLPLCGFECDGEQRAWKERELLLFNDSSKHRAWNHTDKRRIVLLFDVIRPEYIRKKRRVCATVLAALVSQKVAGAFAGKGMLSKVILAPVFIVAYVAVYLLSLFRS